MPSHINYPSIRNVSFGSQSIHHQREQTVHREQVEPALSAKRLRLGRDMA